MSRFLEWNTPDSDQTWLVHFPHKSMGRLRFGEVEGHVVVGEEDRHREKGHWRHHCIDGVQLQPGGGHEPEDFSDETTHLFHLEWGLLVTDTQDSDMCRTNLCTCTICSLQLVLIFGWNGSKWLMIKMLLKVIFASRQPGYFRLKSGHVEMCWNSITNGVEISRGWPDEDSLRAHSSGSKQCEDWVKGSEHN